MNITENFEIQDLGIQEEWVYDIEVQDNHNFFGNNILLHNSVYFQINSIVTKYQENNPGLSINEYVEFADNFEKKVIQPVIQQCIDDFAHELNAFNEDVIGAEREIIADSALFIAQKNYLARVRDNEGTKYPENDPYMKIMGMAIAKSSTPKWCQDKLKEAIPHILDKDEKDLKEWINSIKQEFIEVNPNEIAAISGVTNIDYKLGDKGIPIGARSVLVHNNYIKNNNLENKYQLIHAGEKPKRLYLIEPNPFHSNIIAYLDERFVNEIKGYIDYDKNFEKNFMNPLDIMVKCLNYNLKRSTEDFDDW